MQRRFRISLHDTYEEAHARKRKELEEHPEQQFQVRRHKKTFELAIRLRNDEAETVAENRRAKPHKRFKRRSRQNMEISN